MDLFLHKRIKPHNTQRTSCLFFFFVLLRKIYAHYFALFSSKRKSFKNIFFLFVFGFGCFNQQSFVLPEKRLANHTMCTIQKHQTILVFFHRQVIRFFTVTRELLSKLTSQKFTIFITNNSISS